MNDASVVLNQAEPFTVYVESAEMTIFTISKIDLQARVPPAFLQAFTKLCSDRAKTRLDVVESEVPRLPQLAIPTIVPLLQSPFLSKRMLKENGRVMDFFHDWKPPQEEDENNLQFNRHDFMGYVFFQKLSISKYVLFHFQEYI